ncbi:hypothetical protein [Nocardioides pakistanensis]
MSRLLTLPLRGLSAVLTLLTWTAATALRVVLGPPGPAEEIVWQTKRDLMLR